MFRDTIDEIACNKELPGCSGCDEVKSHCRISCIFTPYLSYKLHFQLLQNPPTCPEWSTDDVTTLLSLDFRLTGMVSALSVLYLAGALIVGALVDNSLANYKSDFV